MSASMTIDANIPEEILESFLGRMSAPKDDPIPNENWWKQRVIIALLLGVGMGMLVYLVWTTDRENEEVKQVVKPRLQLSIVEKQPNGQSKISESGTQAERSKADLAMASNAKAVLPATPVAKPEQSSVERKEKTAFLQRARPRITKHIKTKVPRRLLRRGWRFYNQGNYQSAAVAFGRAVHSSPRHTGGYYGLALCLFEQGKEQVALKVLERGAKKVGPKSDLWVLAGSIYQWMGKERMARIAYKRYLKKNPHGAYARDVRVILSRKELPKLLPFDDDLPDELLAKKQDNP